MTNFVAIPEAFLHFKWNHNRKFFLLLIFIYSVFVLSFSTVAHFMSQGYGVAKDSNATVTFSQQDVVITSIGNGLVCFSGAFLFVHALIQVSTYTYARRVNEPNLSLKMVFLPLRKIVWELELLLNLVAAFGAISICISLLTLAPEDYFKSKYFYHLYHLASWIVLIVWTNLMLLIGRLPKLGCYSLMLTTVTKNFLKVMTSFIFLVIGFALSFTLIFPTSEFFRNPWSSFVRTIVMMIGEFEYTSTYSDALLSISSEVSLCKHSL